MTHKRSVHQSELAPEIYLPLIESLFQESRTLLMGMFFIFGSIYTTFWKTGELPLLACALAFALVAFIRIAHIKSFWRARPSILTIETARRWELGYAVGAVLSVALLGLWCFLTFALMTDPFAHLISFSMTMGYIIGIVGRNFGHLKFVELQIYCAGLPMTAALILHGDTYHWVFAALLAPFFLAVKFISERVRNTLLNAITASAEAAALAKRLDTALTNMPCGVCMFDNNRRVVVANGKLVEMLKLPAHQCLKDMTARELLKSCARVGTIQAKDAVAIAAGLNGDSNDQNQEWTIETKDGRTLAIVSEPLENGGFISLVQDISERRAAERTITHLARFDPLTGLPNRNTLNEFLTKALSVRKPAEHCAIHFIDLDQFKSVNDTLGHSRGDMLLEIVARRLEAILQPGDIAARFGGDEFVVFQSGIGSNIKPTKFASRIINELSHPYMIDGNSIVVGASAGIALCPNDGRSVEELLKHADMALYHAKAANRGTWRFYDARMNAEANARRQLEIDIRKAVELDQFEVHFQPIIDIKTGQATVCEALLRWTHPERGPISPAEFIPVAEDTGAIVALGNMVLHKACQECTAWPNDVRVAVNISPLQFSRSNIADVIANVLEVTGLPAARLEVEITEGALLHSTNAVHSALQKLRSLGITISLDDFGTGYSSLSYLHSFPLDKVKIDRSYLDDVTVRKRALTLLRGISRLSAELGLRVTIEGIETQNQLDLVTGDEFISEAQGYLFARPMPRKEIRGFLRNSSSQIQQVA